MSTPAPPQDLPASNATSAADDDDPWRDIAAAAHRHLTAQRTTPLPSLSSPNTADQPPPPPPPAHDHLLTYMHALHPFSTATSIFDNGTGTGAVISAVLDRFGADIPADTEIRAGDSSAAMLDVLRGVRLEKLGEGAEGGNGSGAASSAWERLAIEKIDAHTLAAIPDGSVSHVVAGHVYFLLPDYDAALEATLRVLRKGGVVGLTSGKGSAHIEAIEKAVASVRRGSGGEAGGFRMIREEWRSEEGVRGVLERAGFVDVRVWEVPGEMRYGDLEGLVGLLVKMPVLREVTAGWSEGEMGEFERVLVEELRVRGGGEKGVLKGVNFVVLGRKA